MTISSEIFFQKTIHSLARSLAHINPTPDDKVSFNFSWNHKNIENFHNWLIIDFSFCSSSNFSNIVHKRAQAVFSALTSRPSMRLWHLAYIFSKATIRRRKSSFLICWSCSEDCRSQCTRKKIQNCSKSELTVSCGRRLDDSQCLYTRFLPF